MHSQTTPINATHAASVASLHSMDHSHEKPQNHPFHLVDPSPWPLFCSIAAFSSTVGGVMYFHGYQNGGSVLGFGICMLVYGMAIWWRDVLREATFGGHHTKAVQRGLRFGMVLFIVSEIMFFFAFFWAFFHSSLSPTVEIGAVWPPHGILTPDPWSIPLLNTVFLLSSGASLTWAHHAIVAGFRKQAITGMICTIVLGMVFTGFQVFEYMELPFTISDSVYGSCFYLLTGFHGFHVLVGTLFLIVCFLRLLAHHFTPHHHIGFEAAAWYWHFVDVVWLLVFLAVYWWGGK